MTDRNIIEESLLGQPGMSLRDWFAGQALGAMMGGADKPEQAAFWAYELANAMIAARDKS